MNVIAFAASDRGQRREGNEDQYLIDQSLGLYVVCDGMGGHAAGEVAAQRSVSYAADYIRRRRNLLLSPGKTPDGYFRVLELAEEATREASRHLYELACSNSAHAGMGTTMTMLLLVNDKAIMAHVGDSRLYILRGDRIHQLSSDHTLAEELVQVGSVSRDEASARGFDHVLTRTVGTQKSVQVESLLFDIFPGDTCLLCSDGLSNYFSEQSEIAGLLGGEDLASVPTRFIEIANSRGGADNITAIVLRALGAGGGDHGASETQHRIDTLRSTFLCRKFSVRRLMHVLNAASLMECAAGQTLLADGQTFEGLYVVLDGLLRVDDDPILSGELLPGDWVGESSLLHPAAVSGSIVAEEPSRLLLLSRREFTALTRRLPKLGNVLLRNLGRHLNAQLDEIRRPRTNDPADTMFE